MSSTDVLAQARIKTETELRRENVEMLLQMIVALEARIAALEAAAKPS